MNSPNRSGETKYSCRMSVRRLSRLVRLETGSFMRVLRVETPEVAAGATTLSTSQRVRLAPSEPVWARYISRDMEETMPPAPAAGSPPPEGTGR